MAETMNTQNILQLIRETVKPGQYDAAGDRLVMVSIKGDFAPEEAWATFRPSGFNENAWAALERTHQVFQGTIRWDYGQVATLLRMVAGAPVSDSVNAGTRELEFEVPESGPRNLDGSTFTVEYGLVNKCDRHPYGLLMSITLPTERMGDTVEGQVNIICQKASDTGVAMTGTTEQSDVFDVTLADQTDPHTFDIDGTTITVATDDTASDVQTSVQAIGGDWAAATVTLDGLTFTIDTGADKELPLPTSTDPDVTITHTQKGSDGTLSIPARIPMLNKNFTVRMANDVDSLDAATPLNKAMMANFDLSALVNPIWFFDENEESFLSHVDGEEPQRQIGLRVSQSSSDLSTLQAQRTAQPATPKWYQLRGVHADNSKYSFKADFYASPSAAVTLGAGNNVRYVEFPMATVISGKGYAMRFRVTEPA